MEQLYNLIVNTNFSFLWIVIASLGSVSLSLILIPCVINIAHKKNLMAVPCDRSSHTNAVPTLGGVSIFICVMLVTILYCTITNNVQLMALLLSLMILFFLGVNDDLMTISPKTKFIGQLVVSSIIIIISDVRIVTLNGLFGLYEFNYLISFIVTLFTFILIINSYNLIDGIDGLAGTIGITVSAFFAIFFFMNNILYLSVLSLSLLGALIGFLKFNLSIKNKIFMGDTGSMIVGFLLSFLSVTFLNSNSYEGVVYSFRNPEIVVIALLFYPMLDTSRIFFVRKFIYKKSPFIADKNHIHHRILQLFPKHTEVTQFIFVTNLVILSVAILTSQMEIHASLLVTSFIGITSIYFPFMKQDLFPNLSKSAY